MLFKVSRQGHEHYHLNAEEISFIQKRRVTKNNVNYYDAIIDNVAGLTTTSEHDADAYMDLIVNSIADSRRLANPADYVVDLTTFGIPKVVSAPESMHLSTAEVETTEYISIFHSDSNLPLTYEISSSNSRVATARIVTSSQELVVTANGSGSAVISIKCKNTYGSVVATLGVTVT